MKIGKPLQRLLVSARGKIQINNLSADPFFFRILPLDSKRRLELLRMLHERVTSFIVQGNDTPST